MYGNIILGGGCLLTFNIFDNMVVQCTSLQYLSIQTIVSDWIHKSHMFFSNMNWMRKIMILLSKYVTKTMVQAHVVVRLAFCTLNTASLQLHLWTGRSQASMHICRYGTMHSFWIVASTDGLACSISFHLSSLFPSVPYGGFP